MLFCVGSVMSFIGAIEFLAVFRSKYQSFVCGGASCSLSVKFDYGWVLLLFNGFLMIGGAVSSYWAYSRLRAQQMSQGTYLLDFLLVFPGSDRPYG